MPGLSEISVIVADADDTVRKMTIDALKSLGFTKIRQARSGEQVLSLVKQQHTDLLLTEWDIESMNGVELVRYLRKGKDSPNQRLSVIMVTARNSADDVRLARDAGITEYLVKPFTVQSLCDRLFAIVEKPRDFVIAPGFTGPDRRRKPKEPKKPERRLGKRVRRMMGK